MSLRATSILALILALAIPACTAASDPVDDGVPDSDGKADRSGSSGFIEIRQGMQGWAGIARVDLFDPDRAVGTNSQRRVIAGGAYWFVWPRSRVGLVVTNEQVHYDSAAARVDENRLLVQTHIEF